MEKINIETILIHNAIYLFIFASYFLIQFYWGLIDKKFTSILMVTTG